MESRKWESLLLMQGQEEREQRRKGKEARNFIDPKIIETSNIFIRKFNLNPNILPHYN